LIPVSALDWRVFRSAGPKLFDEVVGWGYDEESAIKIAQALNLAERL
jgi:hypothetical protein